jgi:hypothetical protein
MGRRQFMGLVGGTAASWPRAVRVTTLPDTTTEDFAQKEEQDFPLIIATMPATGQQRAIAVGVAVLLIVTAAAIAPFASVQLGRVDAFIPVLQTVVSVVDLVTASLLFGQYSIQPQRALSRACEWLPIQRFVRVFADTGLSGRVCAHWSDR